MRAALSDMYNHSWRLLILNLALSVVAVAPLVAALWAVPALVLLLAVGPFAAALMHCAVTVQQTDRLRLRDGVVGLRLHWRRGFVLAALAGGIVVLVVTSISFYAPRAWPVALVAFYGALLFGVWQIHVWPLAVARRRERLAHVLREAARAAGRRPLASIGLASALLLVNAAGVTLGVLPALTLTVAYSALAAAHFVLPPPPEEASP